MENIIDLDLETQEEKELMANREGHPGQKQKGKSLVIQWVEYDKEPEMVPVEVTGMKIACCPSETAENVLPAFLPIFPLF